MHHLGSNLCLPHCDDILFGRRLVDTVRERVILVSYVEYTYRRHDWRVPCARSERRGALLKFNIDEGIHVRIDVETGRLGGLRDLFS